MPLPAVDRMPALPMRPGADHEVQVAKLLAADSDAEVDQAVLEYLDPRLDMTSEDRAVLYDEQAIERVYAALARIGPRISRPRAQPPHGFRAHHMKELRSRVAVERRAMSMVVRQMRDAAARAKAQNTTRALELTARVHHHTHAVARDLVIRRGKSDEQAIVALRARIGFSAHEIARRLEWLVDTALAQHEAGYTVDVTAEIDALAADLACPGHEGAGPGGEAAPTHP